jgi:hypothetical protein
MWAVCGLSPEENCWLKKIRTESIQLPRKCFFQAKKKAHVG